MKSCNNISLLNLPKAKREENRWETLYKQREKCFPYTLQQDFLLVFNFFHIINVYVQTSLHVQGFFRLLAVWVLPCFLLKAAREVFRIGYIDKDSWWQSAGIIIGLLFSWIYSNIIFLSGSGLFNLVCNLQVIHFENYGKLLETDLDVSAYIEEHIRLTHHLSKISHRFRIFLLLEFLVVTASQFVALLQTTGNHGIINFINGGDFAVSLGKTFHVVFMTEKLSHIAFRNLINFPSEKIPKLSCGELDVLFYELC